LFADDVEAAVPRLTSQHHYRHDGSDHTWGHDEERYPSPSTTLAVRRGLLL
jgi:hypothetical protein